MNKEQKEDLKIILTAAFIFLIFLMLTGCTNTMAVLDGATHVCENLHVEGFYTDTQGDVIIVKAPDSWTPEQVQEFCKQQ